jgi:hypothetical protein
MSEFSSLDDLIKSLPPERQAEVYQIAHGLNIRAGGADEFLYAILIGLGYHKTVLTGLPDSVTKAGAATTKQITQALDAGAASIIEGAKAAQAEIEAAIGKGTSAVQIAAQKGAKVAVENADLSRILEQISKAVEKSSAKTWFAKAMVACSVAVILSTVISSMAGWFIKVTVQPVLRNSREKAV